MMNACKLDSLLVSCLLVGPRKELQLAPTRRDFAAKMAKAFFGAAVSTASFGIIGIWQIDAYAASITVFSVASEYCEKRELGMGRDAAMRHAMNYVMSNPMFDPDYNLPNFSNLVSREVYEQCPQYLNK